MHVDNTELSPVFSVYCVFVLYFPLVIMGDTDSVVSLPESAQKPNHVGGEHADHVDQSDVGPNEGTSGNKSTYDGPGEGAKTHADRHEAIDGPYEGTSPKHFKILFYG